MVFMADLFLPCEECEGRRFKADVLDVKVNGKSIVDVLDLSVETRDADHAARIEAMLVAEGFTVTTG